MFYDCTESDNRFETSSQRSTCKPSLHVFQNLSCFNDSSIFVVQNTKDLTQRMEDKRLFLQGNMLCNSEPGEKTGGS